MVGMDPTNTSIYSNLMERVVDRKNLIRAFKQVTRNKGSAGIDNMPVDALPAYLKTHWPKIKQQLLDGSYTPSPIKRVEIPKANGSKRKLGIPTVVDRLIQQAIAQVLQTIWEPKFHPHSYGFRPKRSAHMAIRYAQQCIRNGKTWVVDLDLESFFDRVNHDRLMSTLKIHCTDRGLLQLINRYLKCKVEMGNGQLGKPLEGVPQGGPLSPLLANIVLNEMDWVLEQRGHSFVRYADDCQIYVSSKTAGDRVLKGLTHFIERTLRLKVNDTKSAVDRPWKRTFLGFTFSPRQDRRIKVSASAIKKLKIKVRTLTRRTRGHTLSNIIADLQKTLLGWTAYFGIAEVLSPLQEIDKWIRRKLRCYIWKQWGRSGYRKLRKLGIDVKLAWNTSKSAHGPWRLSASPALYRALNKAYFRDLGLPEIVSR